MASIFTKIVNGEIPCYKIAETENCLAFLDVFPLVPGHTLVIPKKETDHIFDVDDGVFTELNLFAKKIGGALQKAYPNKRVGISVIGLEVPHAHIHLVPMASADDVNFTRQKIQLDEDEMKRIQKKIVSFF